MLFSCRKYLKKGLYCKILAEKMAVLLRFWQKKWLSCKIMAEKMAIMQDSGIKMVILQVSGRMNGYLARFWQKNGYLTRFWQKNGYLSRFWQKSCKIMHNLARFGQNLPESCKITIRFRLGFGNITSFITRESPKPGKKAN